VLNLDASRNNLRQHRLKYKVVLAVFTWRVDTRRVLNTAIQSPKTQAGCRFQQSFKNRDLFFVTAFSHWERDPLIIYRIILGQPRVDTAKPAAKNDDLFHQDAAAM